MSKPAFETLAASPALSPSRALVSAALAGLLCAATSACESDKVDARTESVTGHTGGKSGASASDSGGASSTGGMATSGDASSTGGTATSGDASGTGGATSTGGVDAGTVTGTGGLGSGGSTPSSGGTPGDAAVTGTDGSDGGPIFPPLNDAGVDCRMDGGTPRITSSAVVSGMTLEKFTADCDARHGTVEIPPHCGGFNTCMGLSYWSETQELTEHTCKGMSSCVGYSCVVCPPK